MDTYGLYLHIPFCQHRCAYCDFNTYSGLTQLIPAYIKALCKELEFAHNMNSETLTAQTVFLGGGTPSLVPLPLLNDLLVSIRRNFILPAEAEITLEANPGTLSLRYLAGLVEAGFNRLSLGMQSSNAFELAFLERGHDFSDVIQGIYWARQAGFKNLNLDLIYGLPGQGRDRWQQSVEQALQLNPEHLSLYALSLEHGTPMYHWAQRGLIPSPDPDLAADQYEWSQERLAEAGYRQYEISNWAKPDPQGGTFACQHNLRYWRFDPYLGFGAGAHGFASGMRTINVINPKQYINRIRLADLESSRYRFPKTPATQTMIEVNIDSQMGEYMMMGMRLVETGVSAADFKQRFGRNLEEVFGRAIERLEKDGLVEWQGRNTDNLSLRLTVRGRLLGNLVFREFI